jgi:hypothetical protein
MLVRRPSWRCSKLTSPSTHSIRTPITRKLSRHAPSPRQNVTDGAAWLVTCNTMVRPARQARRSAPWAFARPPPLLPWLPPVPLSFALCASSFPPRIRRKEPRVKTVIEIGRKMRPFLLHPHDGVLLKCGRATRGGDRLVPSPASAPHRPPVHGRRTGGSQPASDRTRQRGVRAPDDVQHVNWQNRAHFLAMSARLMRRILVDYARSKGYQKRGGEP